jgi:hypothetical protein
MTVDAALEQEIDARVEESATEREARDAEMRELNSDERREVIQGEEGNVEREMLGEGDGEDDRENLEELHDSEFGSDGDDPEGGEEEAGEESGDAEGDQGAVEISDEAIEFAVRAGIPLVDAVNFTSEDVLLRTAQTLQQVKEQRQSEAVETKEEKEEVDLFDGLPELDPEEFDEGTIKLVDGLKSVIKKQQEQLNQLSGLQETAAQATMAANEREVGNWFDSRIQDLGEDFTDALGKGGHSDLAKGSSQHAKREEIARQIAVMWRGYESSGMEPPPRDVIFDQAVRLVLHDEITKNSQRNVSKKLKERSGQHIQPAGGTTTKTQKSPEKEVADLLDEKYFS